MEYRDVVWLALGLPASNQSAGEDHVPIFAHFSMSSAMNRPSSAGETAWTVK
jgi:hypothetical protein